MLASCARAAELGLPSIAFTGHADLTPWVTAPHEVPLLPPHLRGWLRPDGVLAAPELDVSGYLRSVARCRSRFPGLRVLFGSDAHRPAAVGHGFAGAAATALSCGFRPGADPAELWPRRRSAVSAPPSGSLRSGLRRFRRRVWR